MKDRKQVFSIRKTTLGVGSILLGIFLSTSLVQADEVGGTAPNLSEELESASVVGDASQTEESVVNYVADDSKEVGFKEETEGTITLGTKPKVETTVTKAETEYRLDTNKEFGDDEVVRTAQDGVETTRTTYRLVPELSKLANPKVLDETNRYSNEEFYHKDLSQELPSDQIVIDNLFLDEIGYIGSSEYSIEYLKLQRMANSLSSVSSGNYLKNLIPFDSTSSVDDIERYYSSFYISDSLYAAMKVDYLRAAHLRDIERKSAQPSKFLEETYQTVVDAFDSITQRYNASRGVNYIVKDYTLQDFSEDKIKEFDEKLERLPEPIKKNVKKVQLVGEDLGDIERTNQKLAAMAYYRDHSIVLRAYNNDFYINTLFVDPQTGQEFSQKTKWKRDRPSLSTLLHEISHVIDFNSGMDLWSHTDYNGDGRIEGQAGLSSSPEFLDVYNRYFKGKTVHPYFRDAPGEAFAESLGEYIEWKLYGTKPDKYIQRPSLDLDNYLDGMIRLSEGDKYYDSEEAYSPTIAAKDYFEKIYNLLFEQMQDMKVDVATVKTTSKPVQNGLVIYGAKPSEKTTTTTYQTRFVADSSKDRSYRAEIGGQDGNKVVRTSYILENNHPKAVEETISETASVDKVITLGTKADKILVTITFTREEVNDSTLNQGERKVLQVGKNGKIEKITTYQLVDEKTGEIRSETTENVLEEMVKEVILIGTKVVEQILQPTEEEKAEQSSKLNNMIGEVLSHHSNEEETSLSLNHKLSQEEKDKVGENQEKQVTLVTTSIKRQSTPLSMGQRISQEITQVTKDSAHLPRTNAEESYLALIGLGVLATVGFVRRKKVQ